MATSQLESTIAGPYTAACMPKNYRVFEVVTPTFKRFKATTRIQYACTSACSCDCRSPHLSSRHVLPTPLLPSSTIFTSTRACLQLHAKGISQTSRNPARRSQDRQVMTCTPALDARSPRELQMATGGQDTMQGHT